MQPTRLFTILFLLGVLLTIVLSDATWFDIDNDDQREISKRDLFHRHHHHREDQNDVTQPRQCVRCKFSLFRCCYPNICVKRRFRTDKCLRVKG
jgi:hypothetical protein